LTPPEKKVNFRLLKSKKGKETIMIDILSVIIYAGGPSVIISLIAYWTVKGGRSTMRVEKKELLVTK